MWSTVKASSAAEGELNGQILYRFIKICAKQESLVGPDTSWALEADDEIFLYLDAAFRDFVL